MRVNTEPPSVERASAVPAACAVTYSLRQPAQRRSSVTGGPPARSAPWRGPSGLAADVAGQPGHEVVDRHAPLDVGAAGVDPDGAGGDVVVAHDQDVG